MGPTRLRYLAAAAVAAAVVGYITVLLLYRWFPPITVLSGISMLILALPAAGWAFYVRAKINNGESGSGGGPLDPVWVLPSVYIAHASAWAGRWVVGQR